MEIAENGVVSGSTRDLPPSKRFRYLNSHLEWAQPLPLPAKKRVFAPPPDVAAVSVCLPVKKRAISAPRPEAEAAAVPVCLPVKKRAIVAPPPADEVPVCLPAKKSAYAPPVDAVEPARLPEKKPVCTPPPAPAPDAVASACVVAKKRVQAPRPRDAAAGSVPACLPANKPVSTVASTCVAAKKRVEPLAPAERGGSVPVCLSANKRVMPPFAPPLPLPSVKSDGSRLGAIKEARPQGSNKHGGGSGGVKEARSQVSSKQGGGAINARVSNRAEGFERGKELKKSDKNGNHKGVREEVSMKQCEPRSPKKSKDVDKKSSKIDNGKSEAGVVEVRKKSEEAVDAKGVAPKVKEESRNGADEVARDGEQDAAEEDDGVLCAVCGSTDGDPSDPIVFCDGCDLMVHASCYGNPLAQGIPDGDWFCSLCSAKKSKPAARPTCCLCPARGGATKRTTDGRWAHISCALLVPEVFFRDPDGRDGVDCSRVPAHRFTKACYICESSSGCALECSQPKCSLGFHVSCGLDGGLCIEYREGKGGAIVAGFCREHTELWEKQQLTGKYKIVARGQE